MNDLDLDKLFNEYIEPSVKMNKHIEIMDSNMKNILITNFNIIESYYIYYQGNYYIYSNYEKYSDKFLVTNDFISYYKINKPELKNIKITDLVKNIKIYEYSKLLELFPEIQSKFISLIDNDRTAYMSRKNVN